MSAIQLAFAYLLASFAILAPNATGAAEATPDVIDASPSAAEAADAIPDVIGPLIKQVNEIRMKPYCCEITGAHPSQRVADETQRICSCETCQRWAFGALRDLSFPLKSQTTPAILKQVERIFLRRSFDFFANQREKKQKAEELGVLHQWLEQRYGRTAVWPDRCALTGMPAELSLNKPFRSTVLCSCDNCQRWASTTLNLLDRQVVGPLVNGKRNQASTALEKIVTETRESRLSSRASTTYPKWLHQVTGNVQREFSCDLTSKHPEKAVMDDDAQQPKKLCQCDSCQRWALRSLRGLTGAVHGVRRLGVTDKTWQMLKASLQVSDIDFDRVEMSQIKKAEQLGVLDEFIQYRYRRTGLWPDRCAFTKLPSDKALTPRGTPLPVRPLSEMGVQCASPVARSCDSSSPG